MNRFLLIIFIAAASVALYGCKKSSEQVYTPSIKDYAPLTIGKYVSYQLDSLVFVNFGTATEVHSYQVKYETDAQITDNLGRPAYRIIRYLKNPASGEWTPDNTFLATNTTDGIEFVENNMKFLKLRLPFRNNYSWKGNSSIDTYSSNSEFKYLDDWDYTYDSAGVQNNVGNFLLPDCLVVNQRDESYSTANYGEVNYGQEKYAAGIGMVYKKFFHSEYQRPDTTRAGYFVTGSYGITLTMIDHN